MEVASRWEAELGKLLFEAGLLDDESPKIEPAGDGNINWVRRIRSRNSGKTVIAKVARPQLERFPEYETSTERIVFERRYYEVAGRYDEQGVCPWILHFNPERKLLILEDLADAERLDSALNRGATVTEALETIAAFLGRVHGATANDDQLALQFQNSEIQRLHGDHIFKLPYEENEFPLPPEVEAKRNTWKREGQLADIAERAYQRYLQPHGSLLHADVQPGNVLLTPTGPVLLDAEIAHVGDPAFDVGTLLAHLWLARVVTARTEVAIRETERIWGQYAKARGDIEPTLFEDTARYAGLEMMRRTIGAARVPAVSATSASLAVMEVASRTIRNPPTGPKEVLLA